MVQTEAPKPVTATEVLEVSKAFASEQPIDARASDTEVVYLGEASRRIIRAADWESIGLKGETVEFGFSNDFRLPAKDFSSDQIDYFRRDGRFSVPKV